MRVMGIDYGKARTGVAISDASGTLVGQTMVLRGAKPEALAKTLTDLARQAGVEKMVVGLPKNMNGTEGEFTLECRAFAQTLQEAFGEEVSLYDERLTSVSASRILGKQAKKDNGKIDEVAAALILEGYLSSLARTSEVLRPDPKP